MHAAQALRTDGTILREMTAGFLGVRKMLSRKIIRRINEILENLHAKSHKARSAPADVIGPWRSCSQDED